MIRLIGDLLYRRQCDHHVLHTADYKNEHDQNIDDIGHFAAKANVSTNKSTCIYIYSDLP